jgi:tellurite resistance protein TerC
LPEHILPEHAWLWAGSIGLIVSLLLFDVLVVHRRPHAVQFREAAIWTVVWISLGLLFNAMIFVYHAELGLGTKCGSRVPHRLSN